MQLPAVRIRNVRLPGGGGLLDLSVADGRVVSMTPADGGARLPGVRGGDAVDAQGRFLVPGLWDAHVHCVQWALTHDRLDLAGATSAAHAVAVVAERLASGGTGARGMLIGYGFRDGLWPDVPSVRALDEASGVHPVVLVSGDLHCAWINTAAARALDVHVDADGLIREAAWFAAAQHLDSVSDAEREAMVATVAAAAARRGVVGIVDLEMVNNVAHWSARVQAGIDSLRVRAGFYPDLLDGALEAGWRTGDVVAQTSGLVQVGPLKIISDGSLGTRTAYCRRAYPGGDTHGAPEYSREELTALVARAHAGGIATTIHAIGDLANTWALDAFAAAGVGGTIEHAQLIDPADVVRFAELGVVASVQPEHAMDDRDAAEHFWAGHTDRAFVLAELAAAGVTLQFGSDAPVARLDPWVAMSAAVSRSRDGREAWHPEQRISAALALASSTAGRDRVRVGDVADLVLIDDDPFTIEPARGLRTMGVWATMLGGRWTYRA